MASRAGISCTFRKRTLAWLLEALFQPVWRIWPLRTTSQRGGRRRSGDVNALRRVMFETLEPRVLLSADVFQAGQALSLIDEDGTQVTFALSGDGTGEVTASASGFDIAVSGSTAGSAVNVTTSGGDGRAKLHDLDVAGSLQGFSGATLGLAGDTAVSGTRGALSLGNIAAPHQITVSGAGVALQMTAGDVVDLSVDVASAIGSLNVKSWQDLDLTRDVI